LVGIISVVLQLTSVFFFQGTEYPSYRSKLPWFYIVIVLLCGYSLKLSLVHICLPQTSTSDSYVMPSWCFYFVFVLWKVSVWWMFRFWSLVCVQCQIKKTRVISFSKKNQLAQFHLPVVWSSCYMHWLHQKSRSACGFLKLHFLCQVHHIGI
jgi:hypothetical protein